MGSLCPLRGASTPFPQPTMKHTSLLLGLAPLLAANAAADTTVSVRLDGSTAGARAVAAIDGEPLSPFVLYLRHSAQPTRVVPMGTGLLDASGAATHAFDVPDSVVRAGLQLEVIAMALGPHGGRVVSEGAGLDCSAVTFERFGADHALHAVPVAAGTMLQEQWADVGMHVNAIAAGSGAHMAIAFDSSNPSGDDPDLRTPGTGTGNTFAYGNLTIVAEDLLDANGDGLVDDPDDNADGGTLLYTWDSEVALSSVTVVDVDEPSGAEVVLLRGGVIVQTVFVPGLDDNNVQRVALDSTLSADELRVVFSGSGAVAEVEYMPCPLVLNFDTSTTGIPFGRQTGEIADTQWLGQGVAISGVTNDPAAPDAVVLFDTANPTGGDDDLMTPGPGINNTVPRGQVLVLADNVIDADGDGLVDDPGDTAFGGTFVIEFSFCVTLRSGTVLDIDHAEPNCFFEAFDEFGGSLGTFPVAEVGDNSIQVIDFGGLENVRRLELTLCSSGALAELVYCPTPDSGGA